MSKNRFKQFSSAASLLWVVYLWRPASQVPDCNQVAEDAESVMQGLVVDARVQALHKDIAFSKLRKSPGFQRNHRWGITKTVTTIMSNQ